MLPLDLDHLLIKISCEALSAHFQRVRKQVTRELGQVIALLNQYHQQQDQGGAHTHTHTDSTPPPTTASTTTTTSTTTSTTPAALRERLRLLREALLVADKQEKEILERCKRKLQAAGATATAAISSYQPRHGLSEGGKHQLERLIGELMLRRGYFESLALLEEEGEGEGEGEGQQHLFDLDIFLHCHEVQRQLVEERNCQGALAWCADHASKLRRLGSPLEFQLHKQQFLELVRRGERLQAIEYASQHLSTSMTSAMAAAAAATGANAAATATSSPTPEQLLEVQQAMATLAFPNPEACPVPEYSNLFSAEKWQQLGNLFAAEARRCYGMTEPHTTLEACLQAGLTALKTPLCVAHPKDKDKMDTGEKETESTSATQKTSDTEATNRDCPVCSPAGQALANGLPYAHFGNSYLTCRCTGEAMDGTNPPMALPNGRVYSQRAIKEYLLLASAAAAGSSGGGGGGEKEKEGVQVTCPRTGQTFPLSKVRNIYIV